MKKYIVELTSEESSGLKDIIKAEHMAAHKRFHGLANTCYCVMAAAFI